MNQQNNSSEYEHYIKKSLEEVLSKDFLFFELEKEKIQPNKNIG